jgi:glutathione S-transferase
MMTLYSGITDPFSHRCRIVLYEKGMDFEIIDVDLMNKPEDLAVMNPYNTTPVLVERDLVLYESNIINEYIDERFPHPQLMPADPVMRARARLFLFRFEQELFTHVKALESGPSKTHEKARLYIRENLHPDRAGLREAEVHAGRGVLDARRGDRAAAVAPGPLPDPAEQAVGAAAQVRRAALHAAGVHRLDDGLREGDAPLGGGRRGEAVPDVSTKPYFIRAIYEWCSDCGFTPYLSVKVDERTRVPTEYVKNGEIVLNVSLNATRNLTINNELVQFSARFNGVSREVTIPVDRLSPRRASMPLFCLTLHPGCWIIESFPEGCPSG